MVQTEKNQRKSKRFTCYTRVVVNNINGYIRNLSGKGFRMHSLATVGVGDGRTVSVRLIPEKELLIGEIALECRQQWHAFSGDFSYGFEIVRIPDENSAANFKKLLGLYKDAKE